MSHLLNKSVINLQASYYLKEDKTCFCSSIHCSYYACVQMAKHVLVNDFGHSERHIDRQSAVVKGFHTYFINEIFLNLRGISSRDARDFRSTIKDLRNFRRESDYKDMEILKPKSDSAYNKAIDVQSILQRYYSI